MDTYNSTDSTRTELQPKKKVQKIKKAKAKQSFKYRNFIKKFKTHCTKILEKVIRSTLVNPKTFSLYNIKEKKARFFFRYFKSDISRKKNSVLLNSPINYLLEQFIGKRALNHLKVKTEKLNLFNYITHIKWKQFILLIKYDPLNILSQFKNDFPLLTIKNVDIFFSNIYVDPNATEITSKKNVNEKYLSFIREITLEEKNNDVNNNSLNENFNEYMSCFFQF